MPSWTLPDFFNSSPFCPHNFSFQTLSLYFLFYMSYISSHLRTSSINFSSTSEEKPGSTRYKHTLEAYWTRRWTDPFRPVKHSRSTTERNWDLTETFLSLWTYPFKYTQENFTERWRSATERKLDV